VHILTIGRFSGILRMPFASSNRSASGLAHVKSYVLRTKSCKTDLPIHEMSSVTNTNTKMVRMSDIEQISVNFYTRLDRDVGYSIRTVVNASASM
jgi:hypothetical protein